MSTPPQKWRSPCFSSATIHGHSFGSARFPPTMREPAAVLTPQPEARSKEGVTSPGLAYLLLRCVVCLSFSGTLNISILCLPKLSSNHNDKFNVGSTLHEFCTWKLTRRRKFLEKLMVLQLLKKFSIAFETIDFIAYLPEAINL